MPHIHDPLPDESTWRQVHVHFDDYATAEEPAAAYLAPALRAAESAGQVTSWFYIRKSPCWRLRFLPHRDNPEAATGALHRTLDTLREAGHIAGWTETLYEPETRAFGGPHAMAAAHQLFHADSSHILAHVAVNAACPTTAGRRDQRRELSILLCCSLLRGADLDWYEQGDVWARVADTRQSPPVGAPDRVRALHSQLHRLMTVDVDPGSGLLATDGTLATGADWVSGFATCGHALAEFAHAGRLRRGIRAVLAHHVIFHWNRLGLPARTQALLAHTAQAIILGPAEPTGQDR